MKHLVILASLSLSLALVGCSKNKRDTLTAGKQPEVPSRTSLGIASDATAAQREDMQAILLELQRVHFAFDSSTLLPESRAALQRAGELLVQHPEVALYIDGHADLRGTTEYNLALGDRRARAVIDYLTRLGVEPGRLTAVTFGSERPLRDASDDTAHAENRRVEFRLMRGNVQLVLRDGVLVDDTGQALGTPDAPHRS